jgi:hypothetical protein
MSSAGQAIFKPLQTTKMIFEVILGVAYLLIALNSLIAGIAALVIGRNDNQDRANIVVGSLFVVLIMGFIGYNTLAVGVGLPPL